MGTGTDNSILEKRINLLEARQSAQISRIEDLEYKFSIMPFEKQLDEILNHIRTAFGELHSISEVRYAPLENRVFKLTILHEMENRATALENIHSSTSSRRSMATWRENRAIALENIHGQFVKIEEMFPNIDFEMSYFHRDEINPEQLIGTRKVFSKI